ncbi:MAG: efflux transporter, family, subunit, partial [Deltaproteobacteria bacterium]|nr:efflux transporter, family, subunit [Deltaproteobacteria bacterium]
TIQVRKFENILKIPNAAIRYRPPDLSKEAGVGTAGKKKEPMGQRVYILGKDGKPQVVSIKSGVSDGAFTELTGGTLKEGDLLITGEAPKGSSRSGGSPPGMGLGGFR